MVKGWSQPPDRAVRLTAAMIVRDEAHHLPQCLASLRGVVDEIVIVDTGSQDDTVAIATAAGARVLHFPWTGDFSAARNHGLDAARGRWILYIDADERVRPTDHDALARTLDQAEDIALRVLLRPHVGWTPYREFRLWRSDPRIRFRNVMHEQIVSAISNVAKSDGLAIGDCNLELDHVGYEGDQTHKHHRNLPLLRQQLRQDPSSVFNWRHLASVLRELGREAEADQALHRAVATARSEAVPSVHGGVAYVDLIALRHARGEDVSDVLEEAERRHGGNLMFSWLRSQIALDRGDAEEALLQIDRLLATGTDTLADGGIAYDAWIFEAGGHAHRALCLFRMGRFGDAVRAYRRAEELAPGVQEYRVKRQLAETLDRRGRPWPTDADPPPQSS